MEQKKHPRFELEKRRGLFFNFGLMLSLGIVIFAFEFKTSAGNEGYVTLDGAERWDEDPLIPITFQDPPPPKIIAPIIQEVPDEIPLDRLPEIVIQVDPDEYKDIPSLDTPPVAEVAEEVKDYSEIMPEPIGGMTAWNEYLSKNLKYPAPARRVGTEGTVYVSFVVDKSGKISEVQVVRGIGGGCDEEAIRVIQNAPNWKPGYQGGLPTKVRMRVPIRFRLQ